MTSLTTPIRWCNLNCVKLDLATAHIVGVYLTPLAEMESNSDNRVS